MRTLLADARRGHPGLYWLAAGMAALALVTAGLAVVDQRTLVGAPLWFKPLKFSISIALFALALAWMLGQLRERAMRRTGWAIVAGLVLEMVIIVGQAARGQKSHYNTDDGLGSVLFSIMGATITVVWFLTLAIALRFLREPGRDRAMTLAIRLGLAGVAGRDGGRVPARAATAATPSACPTAAPACSSSAGARRAATCASPTSSACTPSRCCRCWRRSWRTARSSRPCARGSCGRSRSATSGSCCC